MARKNAPAPVEAPALPEGEVAAAPELEAIEDLFERLKVPAWQRAGVMRHYRWAAGKRLSEAGFLQSLSTWLKHPVGR